MSRVIGSKESLPVRTLTVTKPVEAAVNIDVILAGQLSNETKRAYRSDLRHFLVFLGQPGALDKPQAPLAALKGVDRATAAAYRDHMLQVEQFTATTVNRHLSTISMAFNALKEEGIINKNPFSWVKRPKVGNAGKTPALTREQAERLLSQPDTSTPIGSRDRIILLLLFFCGLRRSEVVKVAKEDFFEDQGHIMLKVHGKGRSDKTDSVKIPLIIWPEIEDYMKDKDGLLFTGQSKNKGYNNPGKPISPTRLYLLFKDYCRKAGIDPAGFSPHSSRASFITFCLSGGADVRSVMYAARHSDPATTVRYDRQRMDLDNHASSHLHLTLSKT